MDGEFDRSVRHWFPPYLKPYVPIEYSETITSVSFGGMAAPVRNSGVRHSLGYYFPIRVVSTQSLKRMAELPAMRFVEQATLFGTSVDDEFANFVAGLPEMQNVVVEMSAVTQEAYYPKRARGQPILLSGRRGPGGASAGRNGANLVQDFHPVASSLTDDLQIFARAYEEDVDSIRKLMGLAAKTPHVAKYVGESTSKSKRNAVFRDAGLPTLSVKTVAHVKSPEAIAALDFALHHDDVGVRYVAVHVFAAREDISRLSTVLGDEELRIRQLALRSITSLRIDTISNLGQAVTAIRGRLDEPHAPLRWNVIDWLPRADANTVDILGKAIRDPSTTVRAAAARGLGVIGDVKGLEYLHNAKDDPDKFVRRHALKSIQRINELYD
jgi:hypothetical protein